MLFIENFQINTTFQTYCFFDRGFFSNSVLGGSFCRARSFWLLFNRINKNYKKNTKTCKQFNFQLKIFIHFTCKYLNNLKLFIITLKARQVQLSLCFYQVLANYISNINLINSKNCIRFLFLIFILVYMQKKTFIRFLNYFLVSKKNLKKLNFLDILLNYNTRTNIKIIN